MIRVHLLTVNRPALSGCIYSKDVVNEVINRQPVIDLVDPGQGSEPKKIGTVARFAWFGDSLFGIAGVFDPVILSQLTQGIKCVGLMLKATVDSENTVTRIETIRHAYIRSRSDVDPPHAFRSNADSYDLTPSGDAPDAR